MKKLLFLCVVLFLGCEKPEEYCWECWKETFAPSKHTSVQVVLCEMTEEEIGQTMNDNTYQVDDTKFSMRCQRKAD